MLFVKLFVFIYGAAEAARRGPSIRTVSNSFEVSELTPEVLEMYRFPERTREFLAKCEGLAVPVSFGSGAPECVSYSLVEDGAIHARQLYLFHDRRQIDWASTLNAFGIVGKMIGLQSVSLGREFEAVQLIAELTPATNLKENEALFQMKSVPTADKIFRQPFAERKATLETRPGRMVHRLLQAARGKITESEFASSGVLEYWGEIYQGASKVDYVFKDLIRNFTNTSIQYALDIGSGLGQVPLKVLHQQYCLWHAVDLQSALDPQNPSTEVARCQDQINGLFAFYSFVWNVVDKLGQIELPRPSQTCSFGSSVHLANQSHCGESESLLRDSCLAGESFYCYHGQPASRCCCADDDIDVTKFIKKYRSASIGCLGGRLRAWEDQAASVVRLQDKAQLPPRSSVQSSSMRYY